MVPIYSRPDELRESYSVDPVTKKRATLKLSGLPKGKTSVLNFQVELRVITPEFQNSMVSTRLTAVVQVLEWGHMSHIKFSNFIKLARSGSACLF